MRLSFYVLALTIIAAGTWARELRIFQFNTWQEGGRVKGGFESIVDEIVRSDADVVTLSEVRRRFLGSFLRKLVRVLRAKGQNYYTFNSVDSALLSRYPISSHSVVYDYRGDKGSIHKAVTKVGGAEASLYTAHLDYRDCPYYDIRGYDGSTWVSKPPVTDLDTVLRLNRQSKRDDAIDAFIKDAEVDKQAGRLIILGGDFNEPSHLDWTENTKGLRDHRGLVVPWDVSTKLQRAGYIDAYRALFANPVTHPGFTQPADCEAAPLKDLVWSPEADDRERIDFIYFSPFHGFTLANISLVGPTGDIVRGRRTVEQTEDKIVPPLGVWPTDHRALLATFHLEEIEFLSA
eukprot:Gregarina_sp_Poly_1__4824@NODE_256_length_10541_cov_633_466679_g223_i0_p4_GENE_NODE_256_length_10541_cov_633_466679_g223_i0NODE_256_length_10541_cov_633_466679_g223_i0_p4_ORF_typecomplete_len347_score39_94Exo_endo_phos/PF03372_23/9_3e10_NODE_256_length_10541_cov_633_466679_g223_i064127452